MEICIDPETGWAVTLETVTRCGVELVEESITDPRTGKVHHGGLRSPNIPRDIGAWVRSILYQEQQLARQRERERGPGHVVREDYPHVFPMPVARGLLPIDLTVTAEYHLLLRRGKIPRGQDDPWFVYAEGDWVHIHHRSGLCIFQLRFEPRAGGHRVAKAWVNLDPRQNQLKEGADEQAELANQAARLRRILEGDLLHLEV